MKDQEIAIQLDRSDPKPARRVYVRLLPDNGDPNSDRIGLATVDVVDDIIKIRLKRDYLHIKQLSIHGGPNPFGKHPMPSNAGARCPKLISADVTP